MQPTTPFNPQSWTHRAAEIAAWLSCAALFYWHRWAGLSTAAHMALMVVGAGYLFLRFCSLVRWHKDAQRGEGIEQHFIQMGVAANYSACIAMVAALTHTLAFLVYPAAVLFTVLSAINATMLHLYRKDASTTPVNYYSHHKFTQDPG